MLYSFNLAHILRIKKNSGPKSGVVELMKGYVFLEASDCKLYRVLVFDFSFVFSKIP